MPTPTYSFAEQLERGVHWEGVLDEFFKRWYNIREATREEQRKGIDRWFWYIDSEDMDNPFPVEYKADDMTRKTGNVFVETMSVVERNKVGWAWKSEAEILAYLAIPDRLYIAEMKNVREMIPRWRDWFGERPVKNDYWTTRGIPVPEGNFAQVCKTIRRLG